MEETWGYLPAQTFLIFAIDLTRFLQFGLELVDGVLFGVHVHDEGVGCHLGGGYLGLGF